MNKFIVIFFCFFGYSNNILAENHDDIYVAEQKLIGDPKTFLMLSDMRVGGHDISISRWQSSKGIDAVILKLTEQIPSDTIAWSDGEVMHMQWSTEAHSHLLVVSPVNVKKVDFYMSSIRMSSINDERTQVSYSALKQALSEQTLSAELVMDIQDKYSGVENATLMYVSSLPVKILDVMIRKILKYLSWFVIENSRHRQAVFSASTIRAIQHGETLRVDLVDDVGKTFMYVNLSGGLKP